MQLSSHRLCCFSARNFLRRRRRRRSGLIATQQQQQQTQLQSSQSSPSTPFPLSSSSSSSPRFIDSRFGRVGSSVGSSSALSSAAEPAAGIRCRRRRSTATPTDHDVDCVLSISPRAATLSTSPHVTSLVAVITSGYRREPAAFTSRRRV